MKKFLLLALTGLAVCSYAQTATQYDFAKFTPLQSTGTLPDVVEMTGRDFMVESRKNLTKGGTKKDKKAKESFVLQTSYAIKDLFISGRVLYNDPISDYVEKVRREVTASDAKLLAETRIFVIKSSVVNAFATNQGYMFVTTGLLAQLENEAQLAFVICHELIHYQKKHVIKAYVQNDKIDRGEGGYRKSEIDKKYLAKSNYSKEHESEADVNGFDLFAKTRYSLDAINGTFDVLKYSQLPFEDFEFDHKILESEHLVFPVDYIQQEVAVVEGEDEEEDDKTSTHPNLAKRRADIADKISSLEGKIKPVHVATTPYLKICF
ncbi:MAG: M48 family metallopeptidase [Sphingobacteriales bacterium JAD_PAG50586_3]|nr:MAG: M48 family metallopeptidase [Sphingobacteriales bacterium JAD_PAG50586_3]